MMSNQVIIRQMKLSDLPDVIRVCNQAFLEEARVTSEIGISLLKSLIKQPNAQLVAEINGKVVGFLRGRINSKAKEAAILHIAVHPSYQGKGIGSQLIREFEKLAKSKGVKRIILGTPFAREFYEKLGYKCTKIVYALVFDLVGKNIDELNEKEVDIITLDSLKEALQKLPISEIEKMLTEFFNSLKHRYRFNLMLKSNMGLLVAYENDWMNDLIEVRYLYGTDIETKIRLLNALIYRVSTLGLRYVGYKCDHEELLRELLKQGWRITSLHVFWTSYIMEKII